MTGGLRFFQEMVGREVSNPFGEILVPLNGGLSTKHGWSNFPSTYPERGISCSLKQIMFFPTKKFTPILLHFYVHWGFYVSGGGTGKSDGSGVSDQN